MRYRIEQIKLNLDEALTVNNSVRAIKVEERTALFSDNEILAKKIVSRIQKKRLSLSKALSIEVTNVEIIKRSIDARGDDVEFVYTLDFDSPNRLKLDPAKYYSYPIPKLDSEERPVVIGFGPCGMFAALVLARAGLRPIVLERGSDVDRRVEKVEAFWNEKKLDPECNVQFGEGGAGTFSDGKLNTGIKDRRIRFVLETFASAGASEDILIDARPHIGTDVLKTVVKNIREEIISLGGEIYFDTRLDEIEAQESGVLKLHVAGLINEIETKHAVLALGHSARDTVRMLHGKGISMEPKPFSMGVRVRHSQELIDRATYGKDYGHPALPHAYYKLSYRAKDGRGVYSFCMCPGGEIINASSAEGCIATNGMSNSSRDSGFANSGILVDIKPGDYDDNHPLAGLEFQEKYERRTFVNGGSDYSLPTCTWKEYRESFDAEVDTKEPSPCVLSLPPFVAEDIYEAMPEFGKRIEGFDGDDTLMVAIESRSSSPVRIKRSPETFEAEMSAGDKEVYVKGLYPAGEGAGYAGGITSAACDGIKIAEKIIGDINQ